MKNTGLFDMLRTLIEDRRDADGKHIKKLHKVLRKLQSARTSGAANWRLSTLRRNDSAQSRRLPSSPCNGAKASLFTGS